jgi:hypothetical protein
MYTCIHQCFVLTTCLMSHIPKPLFWIPVSPSLRYCRQACWETAHGKYDRQALSFGIVSANSVLYCCNPSMSRTVYVYTVKATAGAIELLMCCLCMQYSKFMRCICAVYKCNCTCNCAERHQPLPHPSSSICMPPSVTIRSTSPCQTHAALTPMI